jgi:hypothetical protein
VPFDPNTRYYRSTVARVVQSEKGNYRNGTASSSIVRGTWQKGNHECRTVQTGSFVCCPLETVDAAHRQLGRRSVHVRHGRSRQENVPCTAREMPLNVAADHAPGWSLRFLSHTRNGAHSVPERFKKTRSMVLAGLEGRYTRP